MKNPNLAQILDTNALGLSALFTHDRFVLFDELALSLAFNDGFRKLSLESLSKHY
jgi:hypothetical protein